MRWLLLLTMLACGTESPPAPEPVPVQGDALEVGQPKPQTLKPGAVHRFHVRIAANHVALGTIEQKGIDVVVTTFDPWGKQLTEIDSPNGERGPEAFVIEASREGAYGIEVKAFAPPPGEGPPSTAQGDYEARVDTFLSADAYAEREATRQIDSPRILALWRALRAKQAHAAQAFWDSLKGKAPIVEPFPGDPKSALVTFVARADAPYVGLFGGPSAREKPMTRLADSNLWYLSARMPVDTRVDYAFLPTTQPPPYHVPWRKRDFGFDRWGKKVLDENNPRSNFDQSRIELPGAPPEPWIVDVPTNPRGTLVGTSIQSERLHEPRKITVYTPPGYDATATYPLVIAFDGEVYGIDPAALLPLPRILDNLIAAKKIPPVVLALVANQGTRDRDLTANAAFAEFVTKELVPKMRADYHAGLTPKGTIVTGSSFGGLCSLYIGLHHSDVVGNVLSQSAALWFRPGDLDREIPDSEDTTRLYQGFVESPTLPLRLYLDAGLFESDIANDILTSNRRMRDVLRAKGYPVRYVEFSGGHDYLMWRTTISTGLIELLQP